MASSTRRITAASDFNKGEYRPVECKRILEPVKGKLVNTLREMHEDLQCSVNYAGGRVLADLKKVNYGVLGGENAVEHLLMQQPAHRGRPGALPSGMQRQCFP